MKKIKKNWPRFLNLINWLIIQLFWIYGIFIILLGLLKS